VCGGGAVGAVVGGGDGADVERAGGGGAVGCGIEVVRHRDGCAAAGGGRVDADAGHKVVDGAGGDVDRHSGRRGPGRFAGGLGQHDVVGGAAGAEPAVRPGGVDGAGGVDLPDLQ